MKAAMNKAVNKVIDKGSRLIFLMIAIASLLAGGCSGSPGGASGPGTSNSAGSTSNVPSNNVPSAIRSQVTALRRNLEAQGYQVSQGYFSLYTDQDSDFSFQIMGSAYGNNPAAPYVIYAIPPWSDEYRDPADQYALGPTPEGYTSVYRLDPREAIVIFGLMPPEAKYFGFQSYLFTREGTFDKTSEQYTFFSNYPDQLGYFFTTVPQNPARMQLFGSISNSNNNAVIENQSGSVWDQERYFISTPDQYMNSEIRKALAGISVDEKDIFTEPIPPLVKLGLDEHADDMVNIIRYAEPLDGGGSGSFSNKWRTDLPLVILRVRDVRSDRQAQPYGPVVLDTRTANDESWLKADFDNLTNQVCARWGQAGTAPVSNFFSVQVPPISMVGPISIPVGMNCQGDTQDTSYYGSGNLPIDNGEIYAMIGALATEDGNASYVGIAAMDSLMFKAFANVSDTALKGSAASYSSTVNNSDKFYVYYFSRNLMGLNALTNGNTLTVTTDMVPLGESLALAQRNYLRPGTLRGPDPQYLLTPRFIKLKRP